MSEMGAVKNPRRPYQRGDQDAPDAYIMCSIRTDAAPAMTIPRRWSKTSKYKQTD
jgi:hypothetical protein